jgi:hypothetical protein
MKKILLAVLAITFVSSLCFAQEATAPTTKVAPTPVETKTFTGKVDSVSLADATKGTKSEIVVLADNGQKLNFVVKAGTPITDKDGKAVALSDIKKDNKVTVEYTMGKMGAHKAQSIKLVE